MIHCTQEVEYDLTTHKTILYILTHSKMRRLAWLYSWGRQANDLPTSLVFQTRPMLIWVSHHFLSVEHHLLSTEHHFLSAEHHFLLSEQQSLTGCVGREPYRPGWAGRSPRRCCRWTAPGSGMHPSFLGDQNKTQVQIGSHVLCVCSLYVCAVCVVCM